MEKINRLKQLSARPSTNSVIAVSRRLLTRSLTRSASSIAGAMPFSLTRASKILRFDGFSMGSLSEQSSSLWPLLTAKYISAEICQRSLCRSFRIHKQDSIDFQASASNSALLSNGGRQGCPGCPRRPSWSGPVPAEYLVVPIRGGSRFFQPHVLQSVQQVQGRQPSNAKKHVRRTRDATSRLLRETRLIPPDALLFQPLQHTTPPSSLPPRHLFLPPILEAVWLCLAAGETRLQLTFEIFLL
jgi:hypothetical protein